MNNQTYVGFDVFDTLIARRVSPPTSLFRLVGAKLLARDLVTCAPETFATERKAAERRCYVNIGHSTSLRDIYRELRASIFMQGTDLNVFVDVELDVEREQLFPIAKNLEYLAQERRDGRTIVYISDMYLPDSFIEKLLRENGIWREGDKLYVSASHGAGKASGKLFRIVLDDLGIAPKDFRFFGNNPNADVKGARKAGVTPHFLPLCNANRYEKILGGDFLRSEVYTAHLAGASKSARLQMQSHSAAKTAIHDVAAGVAAPMLFSYVFWILQTAHREKIEHLYFLGRDGQILLEIANRLVSKLDYGISCSYLHASRAAYYFPLKDLWTDSWYLFDLQTSTSARDILKRLHAADDHTISLLGKSGFDTQTLDHPLTPQSVQKLTEFLTSGDCRALLEERRASKKDLVMGYLSQEGIFDAKTSGVVDIGWSGNLHRLICEAAVEKGVSPPAGFLFSCEARPHAFSDRVHSFFYDQFGRLGTKSPVGQKSLRFMAEMFCAADHGTLTGLKNVDGRIEPELEETWAEIIAAWDFDAFRETVYRFAEACEVEAHHEPRLARDAIARCIKAFWEHPSRAEAEAWSRFPWDAGFGNETGTIRIAEPLTIARLRQLRSKKVRFVLDLVWLQGSLAISPLYVRLFYRPVKSLKRRLGRFALWHGAGAPPKSAPAADRRVAHQPAVPLGPSSEYPVGYSRRDRDTQPRTFSATQCLGKMKRDGDER